MPIDNDYFKKRQQGNNGGGSNNNGGGGNYQPPFEPPEFFKNFGKKAGFLYVIIIIIAALFIFKPFTIIESGQVGIKSTTGKYSETPLTPGFHFYLPVFQKVIVVDTKVRLINYASVETSGGFDQSIKLNPAINILDARGLPVSIELTVQYRLTAAGAPATIATWGLSWEDKIVNPVVRNIVRNVVGGFNAEELPTRRNEIATMIENGIRTQIEALEGRPVSVESVQLREIVLPEKIKDQIERVQIANQEAQRVRYEVERAKQEAEKKAALAQGEADKNRIEAQGRADAVTIEAKAQAAANKEIAQSLTPKLLEMQQIQIQGKFNDALRENKDAKIFLTPGGSTPNIWVDTKDKSKTSAINQ
ncbi:membrane protein [Malaciobacter pacificus]|jgi:regulator of protease activity HflC (stomatin/prohibitin superfamily)|uniref:Prohibitin family protein, SPFH superfamily n=1 Tax=Malaciobacter pacificus TaxID=1080223 RepID=A0A5C2H348_9BACT|nr:SPFH domain-containing protein [Malaciobacter pacificus]QEP33321.1 prohibitin family protein, SPFH superfamily [Malaciobacter pacificus]GGD30438.1 membrane protein [Malaciobacter pacificus]